MPALGMAQENGRLIAWLKQEDEHVTKGEPIMQVETDKATVEIEASATGVLGGVSAQEGEEVPVGQVIGWILSPGESIREGEPPHETHSESTSVTKTPALAVSPVAQRMAAEHGLDLSQVKPNGGRVDKADVLAYLEKHPTAGNEARLIPASPKARRLTEESNLDLAAVDASGPEGAVLTSDVLATLTAFKDVERLAIAPAETIPVSTIWQRMTERLAQSWVNAPHFYLQREVNASRLIAWKEQVVGRTDLRVTFSDLLVKLVASALSLHSRVNAVWQQDKILLNSDINIGLAVAVEDGLIVPVIHQADKLGLLQIVERRAALTRLAKDNELSLDDLQGGTFTISNLGMFGVDVFNAVLNPPQAAILAVGRIADRVVPVDGQPAVQPTLVLSTSYDHRVVDGARGAAFLETLGDLIEDPPRTLE